MSKSALDYFGETLVTKARDVAIGDWDMVIERRAKSERARRVSQALDRLDPDQLAVLKWLVPQIVDTTLFYAMVALEGDPNLSVRVNEGGIPSDELRDISDGLGAELFSKEGWIARFSKHRFEPDGAGE